jgi:hypothetical protein
MRLKPLKPQAFDPVHSCGDRMIDMLSGTAMPRLWLKARSCFNPNYFRLLSSRIGCARKIGT